MRFLNGQGQRCRCEDLQRGHDRLRAVLAVATRPDANEGQGAGDVETETAKQSMGFCHGLDLFNDL